MIKQLIINKVTILFNLFKQTFNLKLFLFIIFIKDFITIFLTIIIFNFIINLNLDYTAINLKIRFLFKTRPIYRKLCYLKYQYLINFIRFKLISIIHFDY